MTNPMHLYVVLPCYNEQENIRALIANWLTLADTLAQRGFSLCICPVDDGSNDDTLKIINEIAETDHRVTPIVHPHNMGLGAGLNTGLSHFLKIGSAGDAAVVMDADNTHDPDYLFSMLESLQTGESDVIIASRYADSSKVVGVPRIRIFLSDGARMFYTIMLGVRNVKDYTCGYRLYSYDIIEKGYAAFGSSLIRERSFACMMELLYNLSRVGARFAEVPFTLRYDQKGGESKMRVLKTLCHSVQTAFRLRFSCKPGRVDRHKR